jgi:hypothetical protein
MILEVALDLRSPFGGGDVAGVDEGGLDGGNGDGGGARSESTGATFSRCSVWPAGAGRGLFGNVLLSA